MTRYTPFPIGNTRGMWHQGYRWQASKAFLWRLLICPFSYRTGLDFNTNTPGDAKTFGKSAKSC